MQINHSLYIIVLLFQDFLHLRWAVIKCKILESGWRPKYLQKSKQTTRSADQRWTGRLTVKVYREKRRL